MAATVTVRLASYRSSRWCVATMTSRGYPMICATLIAEARVAVGLALGGPTSSRR